MDTWWATWAVLGGLLVTGVSAGQGQAVDWKAHAYPLDVDAGELVGPGRDWIVERTEGVKFVLFGEAHNLKQVPMVVDAAHALLVAERGGKWHLALEMGPWTASRINELGAARAIRQHPFSIAFAGDGELALLRRAEDRGAMMAGLDQEFSAPHPLHRLVELAPNDALRMATRRVLMLAVQKRGEFLREDHFEKLDELRAGFAAEGADKGEAAAIFDALAKSMRIYRDYRTRNTEMTGYRNAETRENYMKRNLRKLVDAHPGDGVVIKLGGAHVMEGIGPNRVRTLGNFAQEWAESEGRDALHLAIHGSEALGDELVERMGENEMVLVDCRGLRGAVMAGAIEVDTLPVSAAEIYRYDGVILLRDAEAASMAKINAARAAVARAFGVSPPGDKE